MTKLGLYASMVSVIASVLIYIVLDDSQLAIYVGLWAPTLILYSQAYEQSKQVSFNLSKKHLVANI